MVYFKYLLGVTARFVVGFEYEENNFNRWTAARCF